MEIFGFLTLLVLAAYGFGTLLVERGFNLAEAFEARRYAFLMSQDRRRAKRLTVRATTRCTAALESRSR
jgi:hypothetical protein